MPPPPPIAPPVGPVPPVPAVPPSLPQVPFEAFPGSLTGWLQIETAEHNNSDRVAFIQSIADQYEALENLAVDPAQYATKLQAMENQVMGAAEFAAFLMTSTTDGGTAQVNVVSNFARFSTGLGATHPLNGKTFAFLGETVDEQLPALVMLQDAETVKDLLTPEPQQLPTLAQVRAHYVTPASPTLMPRMAAGAPIATFCKVLALPPSWVPYFLSPLSPKDAVDKMEALVATLDTQLQKDAAEHMLAWCRVACIRQGTGNIQKTRSQLHLAMKSPTIADRKLIAWAKRQLSPYRIFPVAPTPLVPPQALPPVDPNTILSLSSAPKNFSPLEHTIIRLACGLTEAQYVTMRPAIYTEMLSESRSKAKVMKVLKKHLAPDLDAETPVRIFISMDMATDVKDVNFGFDRDYSFSQCHRGISPFAVAMLSAETMTYRKRMQKRADQATQLSLGDTEAMESLPGPCPSTYDGLLRQLAAYCLFLRILVGGMCPHYVEVRAVRRALVEQYDLYHRMSPEDVAQVLWQIFIDARTFFSHVDDTELPTSNLVLMRSWLATGTIQRTIGCPTDKLLGRVEGSAALSANNGTPSLHSAMSSLTGTVVFPASAMGSSGQSGGISKINPRWNARLKIATANVLRRAPDVRFNQIMAAVQPSLKYSAVKIGGNGTCLDMHYFGRCNEPTCNYKHDNIGAPTEQRVTDVLPELTRALGAHGGDGA